MEHNTKQQLNTFVDWCRETFGRFVAWMEDRTDRDLNGAQAVAIAAGVGLAVAGALTMTGWLLYLLIRLGVWLLSGHAFADVGHLLSAMPVVHVALDPIVAWAGQHAAGLPVSAATLLAVWALGGAVLVAGGMLGFRGARIAWPLYGAATAAMAWFGASEPHRPIAAGLIVLAWGIASILVLHRGGRRAPTHLTTVVTGRNQVPTPCQAVDQPHSVAPLGPIR